MDNGKLKMRKWNFYSTPPPMGFNPFQDTKVPWNKMVDVQIFILLTLLLVQCTTAQKGTVDTNEIFSTVLFDTTMQEGVSCYRIPALVTATNGDLLAAIDERVPSCGDLKWSDDINIVLRRSTDNGETWSEIEQVADFALGKSASDPSMIVDHMTGDIILFYNYMDHTKEKDVYYLHMLKSADHGATWSDPIDITSQIAKPEWHNDFKFITSGRGIQTRDGKLVHCMVNLDHGMHLFASDDHGDSWYLIDTPIEPANESKVIELSDGRWMVNARTQGTGLRYVHVSDDEGATWQTWADSTLVDPGCNATIINYDGGSDGKKDLLLFCNANSKERRENLTMRVSDDHGLSWSGGKVIYAGGSAYSSMTMLHNGDIGVFFEKDDYSENVFARLTIEWLQSE